jgi:ATP-dependent DNA helicase RecG
MKKANDSGRLSYRFTNRNDILNRLGLMPGGEPNNTAIAMFGKNPQLEIQMAVFATDVKHTFIDIDRANGTINQLVDIGEQYIRRNTRWRVVRDGSPQRTEVPEVPMDAVREALLNSYVHRDAGIPQINEIAIYSNRIEIYNPGTFPEGLTPEDYINGSESSVQRNPLLAEIMYYSKDIERFGTGLQKIAKECEGAGVRYGFKCGKLGFTVIFYRTEISGLGRDLDGNLDGTTVQVTIQDNNQDDRIAMLLEFCAIARTREEIQDYIGIANRGYFRSMILRPLLESGKLRMTIPDKPNSRNQRYIAVLNHSGER